MISSCVDKNISDYFVCVFIWFRVENKCNLVGVLKVKDGFEGIFRVICGFVVVY